MIADYDSYLLKDRESCTIPGYEEVVQQFIDGHKDSSKRGGLWLDHAGFLETIKLHQDAVALNIWRQIMDWLEKEIKTAEYIIPVPWDEKNLGPDGISQEFKISDMYNGLTEKLQSPGIITTENDMHELRKYDDTKYAASQRLQIESSMVGNALSLRFEKRRQDFEQKALQEIAKKYGISLANVQDILKTREKAALEQLHSTHSASNIARARSVEALYSVTFRRYPVFNSHDLAANPEFWCEQHLPFCLSTLSLHAKMQKVRESLAKGE